jgi:Leucine Rich Repeat (LRR) protein
VKALPRQIGRLTALVSLYVNDNQLTALPSAMGRLTSLQILDVSRNRLKTLPLAMAQLTALTTLQIEGNPFPDPYPSLVEKGQPSATVNVLARLRTLKARGILPTLARLARKLLGWT